MTRRIVNVVCIPTPETCPHGHQAVSVDGPEIHTHIFSEEVFVEDIVGQPSAVCEHGHRWLISSYRLEEA